MKNVLKPLAKAVLILSAKQLEMMQKNKKKNFLECY